MAQARLIWTSPAAEDLDEIATWIALDDPAAARRLVVDVLTSLRRARRFPRSGRWVPEMETHTHRELIVGPCRVIYRHEGAVLFVVHILRAERRLRTWRLQ